MTINLFLANPCNEGNKLFKQARIYYYVHSFKTFKN